MKNLYKTLSIFLAIFLVLGALLTCTFNPLFFFWGSIFTLSKIDKSKVQYYLTDENDKPISHKRYQSISKFKNGLYIVKKHKKGLGIVDYNDKVVIPIKYSNISKLDDYILVEKVNKIRINSYLKKGLYTYEGKKFLPVKYDNITIAGDNFILKKNNIFTVINKKTKKQIFKTKEAQYLYYFDAPQNYYLNRDLNDKNILLNEKGENIVNFEYDNILQTTKKVNGVDVYILVKDKKQGLINALGEILLPCNYYEIDKQSIKDDSVWVRDKNYLWGKTNFNQEMLVDYKLRYVPEKVTENIYVLRKHLLKNKQEKKPYKTEVKIKEKKVTIINRNNKNTYNPKVEKKKVFKLYKVEGDLHVVSVYEGVSSKTKKFQNHPLTNVLVDVRITDKPITLLLIAYDPVLWKINTKNNGKNIKKIYFMGHLDGDVIVGNKSIPITKIEKYAHVGEEYPNTKQLLRSVVDKEPVSFQYKYRQSPFIISNEPIQEKEIEIDPKLKDIETHVQKPKEDKKKAELACFNLNNCIISDDKLSFKHDKKVAFNAWAYSEKAYTSGKKYFEVTVNTKEGKRHIYESENNIGLVAFTELDDKNFNPAYCPFIGDGIFKKNDTYCKTVGITDLLPLKNNSTYGIAVDFDEGKMYVSVDGKWVNSDPKTGKTNYRFAPDGRNYRAGGEVDRKTTLTFNFGSNKFKYAKPLGYSAYE